MENSETSEDRKRLNIQTVKMIIRYFVFESTAHVI